MIIPAAIVLLFNVFDFVHIYVHLHTFILNYDSVHLGVVERSPDATQITKRGKNNG
jgi:hypothetical protein